ncbi:MAG: PAS domain S-box protein, partial [Candidatus Altiarchaeales archaeon]|nr:PAS domain S-box protein [Candidatus Altiarchaeales archaeon]
MTDSLLEERVSELEEANRELQSKIEEFKDEIVDCRRAGQELQESEKRYRALIEGLNEAVYRMSLPDGRYKYFSSAVKSVFGYNAKDFLDNPRFIKKIIHPDSMNYFRKEWMNLIKGKVPPTYEYKIIDPEGNERWIIQSNKGVFDDEGNIIALEGICRDITERRKAGERLHAAHRKLQATLNAIQDDMTVVDFDFNLVDVNDALLKTVGLPGRESVLGRKCFEVLKGREDVCPNCAVAEAYRTKAPAYRMSTPEDEVSTGGRVFDIFAYPIMDERGNLSGAVEFARDITERRRAEEALR